MAINLPGNRGRRLRPDLPHLHPQRQQLGRIRRQRHILIGVAYKSMERMQVFVDRYPLVGPALWVLSVQYFAVQLIVAAAWSYPYSWLHNTISDLGNTACGPYGGRLICSPQHNLMNASFIILGITMFQGAMLIYQEFGETSLSLVGFSFMALAGFGTILVGLFPENTIGSLHYVGALLPFLIGNLGILILGLVLNIPKWLRVYSRATGIFTLAALALFTTHTYLGLDIGGMERLTAYPQTVWLIVFGIYISRNRYTSASKKFI
jgi:hypothetical membrane protein